MPHASTCPRCGADAPLDSPVAGCPKCLMLLGLNPQAPARMATTGAYAAARGPAAPQDIAASFPQLEILQLLGQGGMGAVYQARQKSLDRLVALKVLASPIEQDPSFAERFAREARALAKLNHPSIVTVYEFGEASGVFYLMMEYVDGVNLRRVMQEGRLGPAEALSIVRQICEALEYAHETGVVHRDVKPENILIDQRGRVKIADFGLAKILERPPTDVTLTGLHQVVGTPHYMAPEQMEKPQSVDHRADIYSLGVVFYELLTGELPLGRFAPPSRKTGCSNRLDHIVLRALEKEPEDRYQQVSEVRTDVRLAEQTDEGEPVAADVLPPRRNVAPPSSGRWPSVPCRLHTGLDGIIDTHGVLRWMGDRLLLQHRTQDGLFGASLGRTTNSEIPLRELDNIEFHSGLFRDSLTLSVVDLELLESTPGARPGSVKLTIARGDRPRALELVRGVRAARGWPADDLADVADDLGPRVRLIAWGLAAILALSMLLTLAAGIAAPFLLRDSSPIILVVAIAAAATSLSLLLQMWILAGAWNLYHGSRRRLVQSSLITAMFPVYPLWLLAGPLAAWGLYVISGNAAQRWFGVPLEKAKPPEPVDPQDRLQQQLAWPVGLLKAIGLANLLWGVLVGVLLGAAPRPPGASLSIEAVLLFLGLLFASLPLLIHRRSGLAALVLACGVALTPVSPLWLLSAPAAVWVLTVLFGPVGQDARREPFEP